MEDSQMQNQEKNNLVNINLRNMNPNIQDIEFTAPKSWKILQVRSFLSFVHKELAVSAKENRLTFVHKGEQLSEDQRLNEICEQLNENNILLYVKVEGEKKENYEILEEIQSIKIQRFLDQKFDLMLGNNNCGIQNIQLFNPKYTKETQTASQTYNQELQKLKTQQENNNSGENIIGQEEEEDENEEVFQQKIIFHLKWISWILFLIYMFKDSMKGHFKYLFYTVLIVYYILKIQQFNVELRKKEAQKLKQKQDKEKKLQEEAEKQKQEQQEQKQKEENEEKSEQKEEDKEKLINSQKEELQTKQETMNKQESSETTQQIANDAQTKETFSEPKISEEEKPLLNDEAQENNTEENKQDIFSSQRQNNNKNQNEDKNININELWETQLKKSQLTQEEKEKEERQIIEDMKNDEEINKKLDLIQQQLERVKIKDNKFKVFSLRIFEFIYCFFISLFPTWTVEVYNHNHNNRENQNQNNNVEDTPEEIEKRENELQKITQQLQKKTSIQEEKMENSDMNQQNFESIDDELGEQQQKIDETQQEQTNSNDNQTEQQQNFDQQKNEDIQNEIQSCQQSTENQVVKPVIDDIINQVIDNQEQKLN